MTEAFAIASVSLVAMWFTGVAAFWWLLTSGSLPL